jgi:hypothetical protein
MYTVRTREVLQDIPRPDFVPLVGWIGDTM